MKDIWKDMEAWAGQGGPFVLARVVQTWRSAPRQAGAAMIVGPDMRHAGSVSGGCIEASVMEEAQLVLQSGQPKTVTFGVDNELAWSVGLSCGGEVSVYVEQHPSVTDPETWEALRTAVNSNRPVILLTRLSDQQTDHLLVNPDGTLHGDWASLNASAVEAALDAYQHRKNVVVELEDQRIFIQVLPRKDRLVIIGAGHLSVHLVQLAHLQGFETVVIEPRSAFANPERFDVQPDRIIAEWPQRALEDVDLNEDTYTVLLTHDPKIDDPALHIFLKNPVAYVGALGSRKTHAGRCDRLREHGFTEEQIKKVRGPVGLDIGAKVPAEIALSIMAEIIAAKRIRDS